MVVVGKTWSSMYSFTMAPVPVERIDVLESRLADVEEEGCGACRARAVTELKVQPMDFVEIETRLFVTLRKMDWAWEPLSIPMFKVKDDTTIVSSVTGPFLAAFDIAYCNDCDDSTFEMWNAGKKVFEDSSAFKVTSNGRAFLSWPLQMEKGRAFWVATPTVQILPGTRMVLTKLGS